MEIVKPENFIFRDAHENDITQLHAIRMSVKENALHDPDLVKLSDYHDYLTRKGKGWVCEWNSMPLGFGIIDGTENSIWALFVKPGYEGKKIGQKIQSLMLEWHFTNIRIPYG